MKALTKRIYLIGLTALCSFCLLLACMFSFVKTSAKADNSLEAEFTNNGQFSVSMYNGAVPFEYVDGASEGLPEGYDGSVLKITTTSGAAYATLDFSASQIKASSVESIVVRMYSPEYTAADEFRTNVGSDGAKQVLYGAGAYDMGTWCDITLNETSISTLTDANGYLANIAVGARVKGGASVYYIDSITVNTKADLEGEFTNNGQFAISNYLGDTVNYVYEFVDGASEGLPAGSTGSVLKILASHGAPYVNLDFTASKISASKVESVVARVYSPDYTADDELRINNASGSVGGAGAYDLSTWCDVELPLATITGANGCLGSFAFGLRDKGTISDYFYIDSITVNMKETVPTTKVSLTLVHDWWNNYFHDNTSCTILEFSGGIALGDLLADYSDVYAKATLNDQPIDTANLSFVCRNWVDGGTDSIVMRWVTLPDVGSILYIPAGATFVNGSIDSNVYEIAEDIYLQYNGATWAQVEEPVAPEAGVANFVSPWNSVNEFNSNDKVLLQYSTQSAWNYADKGDLASKITYINTESGVSTAITSDQIVGWEGQQWLVLTGLADYDKVSILPGGTFGGVGIPGATLYKVNGRWTPTAPSSATTNYVAIAGGWNNDTTYAPDLGQTILAFDVNPLGAAADATNLAGTINRTSLMVKYNGTPFCELFTSNSAYAISYAHAHQYFYFAIPAVDLVEGATFEIEEGTPFAGQSLGAVKLVLTNGVWETVKEEVKVNYTPNFVKIGTLNHFDNGDMGFGLSLVYDTTGFVADGSQVMAVSYTGVSINGEMQSVALWGGDQLLFWIKREKCEVGYNGYSHATLEIAEGAKIVNQTGEEFTLGAATLYLVNGEWTTEKPADYNIFVLEPTTFVALGDCTKNEIVLQFTDNATWTEEVGAFAEAVLLDGATTLAADGGSVAIDALNKTITVCVVGDYTKAEIVLGAEIAGIVLPAVCAYSTESGWELTPQKTVSLVGVGVFGNNNLPTGNCYHTVLQFNEYFVMGNAAASDAANMAAVECEISTKVTLNGKSFYELYQENPLFYIGYMSGGAYFTFQIPQTYLDGEPENGYEYHTIEIPEGTTFYDWLLPAVEILSFDKVWLSTADFDPTPLPYVGIPYGWNAINNAAGIDTILQFGEYGVDFLGADNGTASHADPTNVAKLASEQISTKLTINGVPVKDIEGVTVSYAHGYNFLYISVPVYELTPNDEYKCVTLHIEQNTVFKKSVLSEVTLYLLNGQWQEEKPDTVGTDEEGSYLTANDIFNGTDGEYKLSDTEESVEIISTKTAGASSIYNFLYKSDSIDFDYSLYTNVGDGFSGVRVMVFRNENESMQGFNVYVNGAMAGATKIAFTEDEWYALRIATTVEDGKISVSVAVDGIVIISSETEYDGAIGDQIKLKKSYGSLSFADFRTGDIKKPSINWQGKNVYRYEVGEEKPNDAAFLMVLSAMDNYDKASLTDSDFVIAWQDGAVVDGKLVAGEWTVTISVSDTAGNEARIYVQVLVFNPNEVEVEFHANDEVTYAIAVKGGLIEKPADPTKHGDESIRYVFDGWYVGDKKWDFANDYAFENVQLTAVFKAEYKEYTVTIVSEGLEKDYSYVLKLHLDSTIDQSIFARDGYSYILTCGGEVIDNVTVSGDMQITVVYTPDDEPDLPTSEPDEPTSEPDEPTSEPDEPTSEPDEPTSEPDEPTSEPETSEEKKSGCFGSVNGAFVALAMAAAASAVIFVKTSKGGKEND